MTPSPLALISSTASSPLPIRFKIPVRPIALTYWSLMLCLLLPAAALVCASVRAQAELGRLLPAAAGHLSPESEESTDPAPEPSEGVGTATPLASVATPPASAATPPASASAPPSPTPPPAGRRSPTPVTPPGKPTSVGTTKGVKGSRAGQRKSATGLSAHTTPQSSATHRPSPPAFQLLSATSHTPLCEDVYVYIITDWVHGGDRATLAIGKRSRGTPVTVGATVGDYTVIKIGQLPLGQPAVWLAEGDVVCRAMLFDDNPRRKKIAAREASLSRAKRNKAKRKKKKKKRRRRKKKRRRH
jgi:hypothetical protein